VQTKWDQRTKCDQVQTKCDQVCGYKCLMHNRVRAQKCAFSVHNCDHKWVGVARTIYAHRTRPNIQALPCLKYCICIYASPIRTFVWFRPTLQVSISVWTMKCTITRERLCAFTAMILIERSKVCVATSAFTSKYVATSIFTSTYVATSIFTSKCVATCVFTST
jgi:hypothetical protein